MESNIYTVLSVIAFLVLVAAVVYVILQHQAVFGGNPFSVTVSDAGDLIRATLHHA